MNQPDFLARLAEALQTTPSALVESAGPAELSGWDSMASLGIISLLDDAGAHDITTEDAAAFRTIGDILAFARARGVLTD